MGLWYKRSSLLNKLERLGSKPWFICEKPDKTRVIGVLIEAPVPKGAEQCYLFLTCEEIPDLDTKNYSALTFMGGFDPKEIALDHNVDTNFLTLSYPVEQEYKDLLLSHYTFLKRPVFVIEETIFVGNAKKTVEALKEYLS